MDVRLNPRRLSGTVCPPPSKSMSHRAILASALAGENSRITNPGESEDIEATQSCIRTLRNTLPGTLPILDCGESGSTLRFLIPTALVLCGGAHFLGHGRLLSRPMKPYFDIFNERGIFYKLAGGTLTVQGKLIPGEYRLPGDVSSQFVTGLLYALPLLDGDSRIIITTPLESRGYVDMTIAMLEHFGIRIFNDGYRIFIVPGNQRYIPCNTVVEADWSQAAFWYAARFLENPVQVSGMNPESIQGDRVIAEYAQGMKNPGEFEIDLSDCPDLLPPLSVMAAVRNGDTHFTHAARLRMKESDRLASVHRLISSLGGKAEEESDGLTVHGGTLSGGMVDGCGDHRIVMAAAIAATVCREPVTIRGAEAAAKSYPVFWEDYRALGGDVHVL